MITSCLVYYVTQNSSGCRYWTWHHEDAEGFAFRCVVMEDILNTAADSNAVSGTVFSEICTLACAKKKMDFGHVLCRDFLSWQYKALRKVSNL